MSAGFDRDHVGGDRSNCQSRGDTPDHILGCHRPVQEKNIDQGPGAAGIPVCFAGRGPERFMGGGESPGCSCVGQSSRAWHGAGFVLKDLEVMIQVHALPVLGHDPAMPGDLGAPVEDNYLGRAKENPHRATDKPGRNGVGRHPNPDEA